MSVDSLHVEFNESDPDDIKGKYGHKIYGYLLPPNLGEKPAARFVSIIIKGFPQNCHTHPKCCVIAGNFVGC